MKKAFWVMLSAGKGQRMGLSMPKTLVRLGHYEVFLYPLLRACLWEPTAGVALVVGNGTLEPHLTALRRFSRLKKIKIDLSKRSTEGEGEGESWIGKIRFPHRDIPFFVVFGGRRRQDSVKEGLEILDREVPRSARGDTVVFIHDAARPFLQAEVCDRLMSNVASKMGVVPGLPVPDTVKELKLDGTQVERTIPRGSLVRVQTPQVFEFEDILEIHRHPRWLASDVTDDAQMAEVSGLTVTVVDGSETMRKLTQGEDWQWAKNNMKAHLGVWDKAMTSTRSSADGV